MEQTIKGKHLTETYWSMNELVKVSAERATDARRYCDDDSRPDFLGVHSWLEAINLGCKGWAEELPETLELAESAVQTAEHEHMMESFNQPVWDVTGAQVDVGAYLEGTPECMIDYPLSETSKVGRVITLVSGTSISAAISTETIVKRGRMIVALALALTRLGHAVEIWAEASEHCITSKIKQTGYTTYQRVLVKGAGDEVDPAMLMFTLAHPAMHRALIWGTWDGLPGRFGQGLSANNHRGIPRTRDYGSDHEMYPEGTIFLPGIRSDYDVPDADVFLREHLGNLGLLAD